MAVQSSFYIVDGATRTFPSTKHIPSKQHCSIHLKDSVTLLWSLANVEDYLLINNSIVFDTAPSSTQYSDIEIRIADTHNELIDSPSNIAIVAGSIANVNLVGGSINDVNDIGNNLEALLVIPANLTALTNIYGNMAELLTIDDSAATATAMANTVTNIYDQFDDRYLGSKATPPAFDNDGNALLIGTLYFDSTQNITRVYSSVGWVSADTGNSSNIPYTIENVAQFTSIPSGYATAIVKDLDRGGTFIWSSAGTANGGTVFTGATGYWNRQYSGAVNVKWFGAKGDTILSGNAVVSGNDDTSAFINAFLASLNIYIPIGNYRITNTIVIPIKGTLTGQDKNYSCIIADPLTDIDCLVVGWYSTLDNFKIKSTYLGDTIGSGSNGLIRMQNTTYSEIPTVAGVDWKLHGGLSYKNTLKNLVLERGQNYNIYGVNVGYTNIENVRSVLARNASGNLYITGTNDGTAIIGSTTVNVKGGEYTASYKGNGISFNQSYTCHINESVIEGNYGRGLLFTNTSNMFMDNIYVENNFALGATVGDGDIVVTGSTRVSIKNSFIYSNNSNASVASSASSKSSLSNTEYTNGLVPWVLNVDRKQWSIARQDNGIFDYGEHTLVNANGTYENIGYWVKYADGTAIFTKRITLSSTSILVAQGNIFIEGSNQVDTDYPSDLFRVNVDLSHEFCASIISMYGSGGNAVWAVSNGASTLNNALRYRLACNVSLTSVSIPLHITMTGRWR